MTDLNVAAEIDPAILRRPSTSDNLAEFKKLSPFGLLGLSGGLFSLLSIFPLLFKLIFYNKRPDSILLYFAASLHYSGIVLEAKFLECNESREGSFVPGGGFPQG